MLVKASTPLVISQRVQHYETKEIGTVTAIMAGRYFVTWDRDGKTFIYPRCDLIEV